MLDVAGPFDYPAETATIINDIKSCKKAWHWTAPKCTLFNVSPANDATEVQVMSAEQVRFFLNNSLDPYQKPIMFIKKIRNYLDEVVPGQGIMCVSEIFQGTIIKEGFENLLPDLNQLVWIAVYERGNDYFSYPGIKKQVDAADDRAMANTDLTTKTLRRYEAAQLVEVETQKAMMRIGAAELQYEVAHSEKP